MFLSKALGHLGPSSIFKCFLCLENNMGSSRCLPYRTLEQNREFSNLFSKNWDPAVPRARQISKLSRLTKSIEHHPIFCIEPKNVIPGSLHCVMGQCKGLVEILQAYIKRCDIFLPRDGQSWADEFELILRSAGIFPTTWFQTFSGIKSVKYLFQS